MSSKRGDHPRYTPRGTPGYNPGPTHPSLAQPITEQDDEIPGLITPINDQLADIGTTYVLPTGHGLRPSNLQSPPGTQGGIQVTSYPFTTPQVTPLMGSQRRQSTIELATPMSQQSCKDQIDDLELEEEGELSNEPLPPIPTKYAEFVE